MGIIDHDTAHQCVNMQILAAMDAEQARHYRDLGDMHNANGFQGLAAISYEMAKNLQYLSASYARTERALRGIE